MSWLFCRVFLFSPAQRNQGDNFVLGVDANPIRSVGGDDGLVALAPFLIFSLFSPPLLGGP
jgi:hypothetical protein